MIRALLVLILTAQIAAAEVRIEPDRSAVHDGWGSLRIDLGLGDVVPYRVFTLDNPRRLIVDLRDVVWDDVNKAQLLDKGRARDLRFGPMRPGWSRLVVDLATPLGLKTVEMRQTPTGADLEIVMTKVSPAAFATNAGAPPDPGWDMLAGFDPQPPVPPADGGFTVVIDPGHGGIDPGAARDGVHEAELMLSLGRELARALSAQPGIEAVLTRQADVFVPLAARGSIARAAGADLFISLHADALAEDEARGASVYTLSKGGGDAATARMIARHERGDLLAGLDLEATGDRVTSVLMDLARTRTGPAGRQFADLLVEEMRRAGVPVNSRPRREGQLAVLQAADYPSVLIEAGFLSNARDRSILISSEGRSRLVNAIVAAVKAWMPA